MKKFLLALMMVLAPISANAASGGVSLDAIDIDLTNKASLQRGMAAFVNRCMAAIPPSTSALNGPPPIWRFRRNWWRII